MPHAVTPSSGSGAPGDPVVQRLHRVDFHQRHVGHLTAPVSRTHLALRDFQSDRRRNQKACGDRYSVEEGMHKHSDERRNSDDRIQDFVVMGFFSEMKMRGERVLKRVHNEVSQQNQGRGGLRQRNTFRKHF